MFQDALFVPDRNLRSKAAALPLAALIHMVALTLLVTVPLLRVGDLPEIDLSDIILVPAPPSPPLPPPKGGGGKRATGLVRKPVATAAAAEGWRTAIVAIPDGIVEEGLGAGGAGVGIVGGVDYEDIDGFTEKMIGEGFYDIVGKEAEPIVRPAGEVKTPRLARSVEPIYPEIARQAGIQGVVILEATTDIYGRVIGIKVLRSIPLLDAAAVEAVRQWVYEPLVLNGRPRAVTFTVTVSFVLKK